MPQMSSTSFQAIWPMAALVDDGETSRNLRSWLDQREHSGYGQRRESDVEVEDEGADGKGEEVPAVFTSHRAVGGKGLAAGSVPRDTPRDPQRAQPWTPTEDQQG
jgi:hypothetical protein